MIEVYLFYVAFATQVLAISLLLPPRFVRSIRAELAKVSAERLAEVYPGVAVGRAYDRFIFGYRAANLVVAVIGVALLAWFLDHMAQPNWDEGRVSGLVTAYFVLQNAPLLLIAWLVTRFNKVHRRTLPGGKRKAILQRRGLFDFVSPFILLVALLAYLQFAVFTFYIARDPFPGFAGPFVNVGLVTLMYLLFACVVYWVMYVRRAGPLETHSSRMQLMSNVVTSYAWICILVPVFLSLHFARRMLELDTWMPFGRSASCLVFMLLLHRLGRIPDQPDLAEGQPGSSPAK
jgi:hypothetical protein